MKGMGQAILGIDSNRILQPVNSNVEHMGSDNLQEAMDKELNDFLRSDAEDLKRRNTNLDIAHKK